MNVPNSKDTNKKGIHENRYLTTTIDITINSYFKCTLNTNPPEK